MRRKPNRLVVGLFWGDEGKAKIVDCLTDDATIVARYQGGANAGHTVFYENRKFVFHQVPSGILHPKIRCVLGAGMVIDLPELRKELTELMENGVDWRGRIFISPRAHLVLPYHKEIDRIQESERKIGTTLRGIGPAYRDKADRVGIRIGEIALGRGYLEERLGQWLEKVGNLYIPLGAKFDPPCRVAEEICLSFRLIEDCVTPMVSFLTDVAKNEGGLLAEGAQGTMLSLNWGTYPFVTSSETTAGGASEGLGIDLRLFDEVVGVVKAFSTRVGSGPFPSEGDETLQKRFRGTGEHFWDEFGATTGRPRRCGWLDGVILKYSAMLNGVDWLALTKLDVLTGIDPLKVVVSYKIDGKIYYEPPSTSEEMKAAEPVFDEVPGWDVPIENVRKYEDLPIQAQNYVRKIEGIAGVPVRIISVGADREKTIFRKI